MLVMPTGAPMQAKWDSASMTSPQMPPYKMERPAYSTPPPVENTPANNECRTVDLRGRQVASFCLNREEYICLPQAFDLFLKNLVGGLHTVYTKLKRLSIHPVVCNVEQVRILRGLGAIQPGVNRCKLITRKDFEILYQDCTTASRPGRPPKRYPMLPPTADLMSHHANMRGNNSVTNSLINQSDYYHKRMRLDHSNVDSSHNERRASGSPVKDDEKNHSSAPGLPGELHNNATANLAYLQQAIRHQYQAATSGLHNGLDPQQINPALAPFMMMSHPALFSSGIPPTSMAMLNHINQIAQSHAAGGAMSTAAAAAAAQLVAGGNAFHANNSNQQDGGQGRGSRDNDKESDGEDMQVGAKCFSNAIMSNGMGSDGRTSPSSSVGSVHENRTGNMSDGSGGHPYGSRESPKTPTGQKVVNNGGRDGLLGGESGRQKNSDGDFSNPEEDGLQTAANMSSMQNLLTNIQGLLKVAADNANLQEKHASYEIADLKLKLSQERQLRENAERKLQDLGRAKADSDSDLHHERKENKRLQAKLLNMQRMLGHDVNDNTEVVGQPSPRSSISSPRTAHENQLDNSTTPTSESSPTAGYPTATSYDGSVFTGRISAVQTNANQRTTPSPQGELGGLTSASNANNSNNYTSDEQPSPEFVRRSIIPEGRTPDLAIDLGMGRQERSDHMALQADARLYFKNSLLYQPSASQ